jgi:O-antigen/teichoic acid export membrane protein
VYTSLKKAAASGVKWKGTSTAVVEGLRMVRLVVLARLLAPEDFGLMAMVTVVIGFGEIYADGGISNAIIHRQNATREQLSSLYWLNIVVGMLVFTVVCAAEPLVAQLFGEPRLTALVSWAALAFLIAPIGQQFRVLLRRELKFKPLAQVEMSAAVVGTAVAVCSALSGQGVFALVWGYLTIVSTKSLIFAWLGWKVWRPLLHFRRNDLEGFIGFGMYQMGSRTATYFASNVDYMIIGRFLGAEVLGVYMVAYQLVLMPLHKLNPVLTQVAFPIFAKKQSDNTALRRGYLQLNRMIAFVTFPALVAAGVTAPIIVPVLFGERWLGAVPLIQILASLGMLKTLINPIGSILLAKGRPDIIFKWYLIVSVMNACVFSYVVKYGVHAVAFAYLIVTAVNFFAIARFMIQPLIGLRVSDYLGVLRGPAVISAATGIALLGVYFAMNALPVGDTTRLLALAALGILVYCTLMLVFERQYVAEHWLLLVNRGERA